jgi:uncharacterized protein (DUF849 family)
LDTRRNAFVLEAVLMAKVMIEAAINGNAMRDSNPHIAYSPDEIAADAIASCKAGAALIHPHVRDPASGEWSHEVAYYAEAFRRIREQCGALLFPTLPPERDARKRYAHFVELSKDPATRPDVGALDMGSLNYLSWNAATKTLRGGVYENSVKHLAEALTVLKECGIRRSTLQVFDGTFLRTILLFLEQGLLSEPLFIKFYFGGAELPMGLPPTPKSLEAYLDLLKGVRCHWFVATLGGDVLPMVPLAVAMGGHVRVGLEDYQYKREGQLSNPQIVERAAAIIKAMGHEIATPADARQMLEV